MALIYIVEDDSNICEIEAIALNNSGHSVESFENAKSFYEKLAVKRPDLIILDIMLPDEDGLEILRKIRLKSDTKRIPVILISAKSTELDRVRGLEMGADDYISKPFGVMELIARVKALLRRTEEERRIAGREKYIRMGDIFIDDVRHVVFVSDEKCELTYKEYELLKLLVLNAGIVLTRDIIMEKVWGMEFEGETRTVDMHIKTLRQKLGNSGNVIKTVRNVGYVAEL
ncbi:MAG: response regulator transcription factor [Clostridiales bacterium]|nr:response regulator transcription factor [Clostridiales bacterium]